MNVYLFQVVNGVGIGMFYFLLVVGLLIIFGLLCFVNFVYGVFYVLGVYFCFQVLQMGMDFWLVFVLVFIVIGVLVWVMEKVLLCYVYVQVYEFYIVVIVGLVLVVQEFIIVVWGLLGVDVLVFDVLQGVVMWGDFVYLKYCFFVIGFIVVLVFGLWWLLEGMCLGSVVCVGSELIEMVLLFGINVFCLFSLMFVLGVVMVVVVGVLVVFICGVELFMGVEVFGVVFVVVVVGGMGSFVGVLVGGVLVGIVQSLMSMLWFEGVWLMIYVVMVVVLLLCLYGLLGRG